MIAGPYRHGAKNEDDRAQNLLRMNQCARQVLQKGHVPIVGVNAALPIIESAIDVDYEEVMTPLCQALAGKCDALLRLPGESSGADDEMRIVQSHGGRIYHSIDDIPAVTQP